MVAEMPDGPISEVRYLELERVHEWKHEYRAGLMVAMPTVNRDHSLIVTNTLASLSGQLEDRACEVYASQMRVLVTATRLYTYPDIAIVCGPPEFGDAREDTLLNPLVIVEVVSRASERYDRAEKFLHYQALTTLREYVLIAQDRCRLDHFVRQGDGSWQFAATVGPSARLQMPALGCTLAARDVYAKVEHGTDAR